MKYLVLMGVFLGSLANAQIMNGINQEIHQQTGWGPSNPPAYQAPIQVQQTDYNCMNQCTSSGSQYSFCKAKCSY